MRKILVGTDFSHASDRAVSIAVRLARRTHAALRIVHIVPPKRRLTGLWRADRATVSAAYQRANAALKRLAETQDPSRQIELSTGLVSGAASVEVARAARGFGADLLVVGALGEHEVRQQQLTLGGTALKLLSTTPVPLLLVRKVSERPGSVLAGVDLSPISTDVLAWARVMAEGEAVTLFHAYDVPFTVRLEAYGVSKESIDLYSDEEQSRRERELNSLIALPGGAGSVRSIVERGDPIDGLFRHIEELEPSLIALGKHEKRRSLRTPRTGSVSRHVAMFAPTNVLIVTTHSGA